MCLWTAWFQRIRLVRGVYVPQPPILTAVSLTFSTTPCCLKDVFKKKMWKVRAVCSVSWEILFVFFLAALVTVYKLIMLLEEQQTLVYFLHFHWSLCRCVHADLLFLVGLTSSVCVVSEIIKKVERWRGAEKTPPTDCFHEVWPSPPADWANGLRCLQRKKKRMMMKVIVLGSHSWWH